MLYSLLSTPPPLPATVVPCVPDTSLSHIRRGTPNVSDAANWGGLRPRDGDSLVFGPRPVRSTANNDLVHAHFRSIQFDDGGYTLTGRGLLLTNGITASGAASGLDTVRLNVTLSS